jgi:hypothetical protein
MGETELFGFLNANDSILMIFIAVVLFFAMRFYNVYSKDKKEKDKLDREERQKNTDASLKLAEALTELKDVIGQSLPRIHERIDDIFAGMATKEDTAEIKNDIKSIFRHIKMLDGEE